MKKGKNNSTQNLIGISEFLDDGIKKGQTYLAFFCVSPTNISVLSRETTASKISSLMQLFSSVPDLGIICVDSCERFDSNRTFMEKRLKEETNEKVKECLRRDIENLEDLQMGMSSAREFMFVLSFNDMKKDLIRNNISRFQKAMSETGFEGRRMKKRDIKRFLSIYFGSQIEGEEISDFEGEEYIER